METGSKKTSPTLLRTQLSSYQKKVSEVHKKRVNEEVLGRLEGLVAEKEVELGGFGQMDTEKDLCLQAQQWDFDSQLVTKQIAQQEMTNTLEKKSVKLGTLKSCQTSQMGGQDINPDNSFAEQLHKAKEQADITRKAAGDRLKK